MGVRAGWVALTGLALACVVGAGAEDDRDPYRVAWVGARFVRPPAGRAGVQVAEVLAGGPAERAGLRVGDEIVRLDDGPVPDLSRWLARLERLEPGSRVALTVVRGPDSLERTVELGAVRVRELADQAIRRGVGWLLARQREDGAWNTATPELVEGRVRASPRNTALALCALSALPDEFLEPYRVEIGRGLDSLERCTSPEGWVGDGAEALRWQNYATAFSLRAVLRFDPAGRRAAWRDRMRAYLEGAQLVEPAGVSEFEWYYGAWSYWDEFRRSNARGDTSITACVVEALVAAGADPAADGMRKALGFLERCQNRPRGTERATPADDGGFAFNPRSSKAGEIVLPGNRVRYRSYGSPTCDGLRAMLALGVPADAPSVRAAMDWLARNYTLSENPGFVEGAPVPFWTGILYYYYWSLGDALGRWGADTLTGSDGARHCWPSELANRLVGLQGVDGSWANEVNVMEENDPLVATPMALGSLGVAWRWVR